MGDAAGERSWDDREWPDNTTTRGTGWQDSIDLLRAIRDDYASVGQQLQKYSETLADREALLTERLRYVLGESAGYSILRLVPYRVGTADSRLGKATLGATARPKTCAQKLRLEVRCLGRFELSWGGSPVTKWQSVKAKAILEYLMTRPREPLVKDVLMETLWPDCDSQSANNNLKAAVHGLRRTLGIATGRNDAVRFVQGSYMLNPEIELWLDVEEFDRHWVSGRRLEKEGRTTEALREFELAQELYRGEYLQDELYEEWTLLKREALKDTYLAVLSKLATYSLQTDDWEGCVIYCQKILEEDPCREDAYRRLMRSYSRMGQRNRALRWYEICCQIMKEQLDSLPDDETQSLYRRVLNNDTL